MADSGNSAIRKIKPDGTVSTLAGLSSHTSGSSDGFGTQAGFAFPYGLTVDSAGNVFVADTFNNAIRKITPSGFVSTIAGRGLGSSGYDNGSSVVATFNWPSSIALDAAGNLYVAELNNNMIRKLVPYQ